jgi:hypothetical protein
MDSSIVQATRFELVDDRNRVRAVLACGEAGAPALTFIDEDGTTRITIGIAWNAMPSIQVNAADGTARVALVARPEGTGMVVVTDDLANSRVITSADR